MKKSRPPGDSANSGKGQLLVYESEDGRIKIDVRLENETVWLTQQLMADLFQTTKQNISLHIQSIYEENELAPEATVKKNLTVRFESDREVQRFLDCHRGVAQLCGRSGGQTEDYPYPGGTLKTLFNFVF